MATFRVELSGQVFPGHDVRQVKERLAQLFSCDISKIESLFDGAVHVLKDGMPESDATRYAAALERAGALVQVILEKSSVTPEHLAASQHLSSPHHSVGDASIQPLSMLPVEEDLQHRRSTNVNDSLGVAERAQPESFWRSFLPSQIKRPIDRIRFGAYQGILSILFVSVFFAGIYLWLSLYGDSLLKSLQGLKAEDQQALMKNIIMENADFLSVFFLGMFIACLIPIFVLNLRRIRDLGLSPMWMATIFLPFINIIFGFYLLLKDGTSSTQADYQEPSLLYKALWALQMFMMVFGAVSIFI